MTKLSDTQSILLSAAAQRSDGNLLPLPGSLARRRRDQSSDRVLARGLAREDGDRPPDPRRQRAQRRLAQRGRRPRRPAPHHPGRARSVDRHRARRRACDGADGRTRSIAYRFNDGTNSAGEPAAGPAAADGAEEARPAEEGGCPREPAATPAPRKTRDDTKQAQLIAMLRRKEGATIAQIVAATGWQPHTVRGAFAGALKKKLGLTVTSEKVEGVGRVYRIGA